jgi:poly(3-hydroxybutyrate) depolymerase
MLTFFPSRALLGALLCLSLAACSEAGESARQPSLAPTATAGTSAGGSSGGAADNAQSGGAAQTAGSSAGGAAGAGATGGAGAAGTAGAGGESGADETGSSGCGKPRTLANGRIEIQSGGQTRSYDLRVPDDYDSNKEYRFVVAYHALGGSADGVAEGDGTTPPYYGLWDLAEGSTIFVAPEGLDAGWANTDGRDVAFTDDIVEQVLADLCIDTRRVFATGFSFGGAMSYALACARADVFRAVAVYSGALLSGCDGGTTPVAYIATRGVQEPSISGSMGGRAIRDNMAMVNGCTAQSPPEPEVGSGGHLCTSYEDCLEGYPVRWCAFDGGHTPSPIDQGGTASWVPQEVWTFLAQF